jgi:hypothetical protein
MSDSDDLRKLRERGAATLEHPGGDLLSHLVRTSERLQRWGAPAALVAAGRWHAAYGTEGFDTALFGVDERSVVSAEIGPEAEAIVYQYGSCDRRFVYGQMGGTEPVRFRDRFTGAVVPLDEEDVRSLAELTVANELDVIEHSESFRRAHGRAIADRFLTWSKRLSPAARFDVEAALADAVGGAG